MTFEQVQGDLFAQRDVAAIGHGVNCRGVMGRGIAVEFRRRFSDMFDSYREECLAKRLRPGMLFPWPLPNGRWVYNLASQDEPGRNATDEALESALIAVLEHSRAHEVASVALPLIGAGIGGMTPRTTIATMERVAGPSPVLVRLVIQPRR
ncbi:macro domain-containing protein [Paenarthrobacter sp. YJN-5]|uniref:macro domain-containing protein n=1 Tax=Paenarthrobacter sp. YJN-5 TaxID=2735316 RepID=UPI0018788A1E|nr:macro domain-containing protein [Paenarthrobacter sp. YJN-5]QOT19483.1 macro domain-containing protein [Paenarthrobacter sp. YJN-5]